MVRLAAPLLVMLNVVVHDFVRPSVDSGGGAEQGDEVQHEQEVNDTQQTALDPITSAAIGDLCGQMNAHLPAGAANAGQIKGSILIDEIWDGDTKWPWYKGVTYDGTSARFGATHYADWLLKGGWYLGRFKYINNGQSLTSIPGCQGLNPRDIAFVGRAWSVGMGGVSRAMYVKLETTASPSPFDNWEGFTAHYRAAKASKTTGGTPGVKASVRIEGEDEAAICSQCGCC